MRNNTLLFVILIGSVMFVGCQSATKTEVPIAKLPSTAGGNELRCVPPSNTTTPPRTIRSASGALGRIDRLDDDALDRLLPKEATIEKLAEGFDWSEGPVWMGGHLLFSDVPLNTIFKWDERDGVSIFLQPSGYDGKAPRGGEPGSNGLTRDRDGSLLLCQHGNRRIARQEKNRTVVNVADHYRSRRFNSPNDLVVKSNGDIYFTDPPYGLVNNVNDLTKELPYQGVYRVWAKDKRVTLLTSDMSRPNGLAFSPDEKILYVANSDPTNAVWMAFPVNNDGSLGAGRVFLDVTAMVGSKKGLPDGLKVDALGNLWATGPGGVLIISPEGKHLGTLATGEATSNCAWGDEGSTLYITADMYLCRVRTKVKGARW
ncbi:MAG TPA: SMP-30/gluconolactonase/LRE family protein [Candidatus Acidoferrum sp.]|nr:SMP-30/gluconolactonase/LRE family protein [Candidatus Acidoferrum sp.]